MSDNPSSVLPLRLGTRSSPLAIVQAEQVCARLCTAHGWGEDAVELVPVVASGDKVQDRPLAEIGGKALWTKELDEWLAEGRIHASVHSLKDVETLRPEVFAFGAILARADRRDRLIGASSLRELPLGAVLGTSAPRRAAQALHVRPDLKVVSLRGNVATRLTRLEAGEVDATFLAAAGLERLGWHDIGRALDSAEFLPAPSQGAIAVECRAADDIVCELIAAIDHAPTRAEVLAERALLEALGGTCHSPVAVLCEHQDGELRMRAALFSPDGRDKVEGEARFAADDIRAPAELALHLLEQASDAIRATFAGAVAGRA